MIAEDEWDSTRRRGENELLVTAENSDSRSCGTDLGFFQPLETQTTGRHSGRESSYTPASERLAGLALRGDEAEIDCFLRELALDRAAAQQICRDVIERAARHLGDWWSDDRCDSLAVMLALSQLQNLMRNLAASLIRGRCTSLTNARVLIAPAPRETHILGVTLLGVAFCESGWSVRSEFPKSNAELADLVSAHWFDAVALTLSVVLSRRDQLTALARTIEEVREASRNPAVAVIVNGRAFRSEPSQQFEGVGADVHCGAAVRAVKDLDEWLLGRRVALGDASAEPGTELRPCDLVAIIAPALVRRIEGRLPVGAP
jgi:methanogenic corrinoid protein MtbC1